MEFKGEAAKLLLETISAYLSKSKTKPNYAKCASIVNLSGMGKSRTAADKLTKKIITVPMCLHGDSAKGSCVQISTILMLMFSITTGFPPPDRELCIWLLGGQRKQLDKEQRLHGFIYGLLIVT